eukprot:3424094-Rhodomonas_salina.2
MERAIIVTILHHCSVLVHAPTVPSYGTVEHATPLPYPGIGSYRTLLRQCDSTIAGYTPTVPSYDTPLSCYVTIVPCYDTPLSCYECGTELGIVLRGVRCGTELGYQDKFLDAKAGPQHRSPLIEVSAYALSGTKTAYAAICYAICGTEMAYAAVRCVATCRSAAKAARVTCHPPTRVLRDVRICCYAICGTRIAHAVVSAYEGATRCPTMSYAPTSFLCDVRYRHRLGPMLLVARRCWYAMCGTEIAYGATRYALLR